MWQFSYCGWFNGNACSWNNGSIFGQHIGPLNRSQSYTYDGLNRISTSSEDGTDGWNENFAYDAFGNMWVANASSGFARDSFTPATSAWFDANNRLANAALGVQHDNAGNLTAIGGFQDEYNADGMMAKATPSIGSATEYRYDGEGRRVTKQTGTEPVTTFVYDAFGGLAAEYGTAPAETGTHYITADHLGSTRLVTDASGVVVSRHDYLPFGEEINAGVGGRTVAMKYVINEGLTQRFTGKEWDAETGLDYFGARYMAGAMGRFTSADPLNWLSWQNGNEDDRERFQAFIADPQGINMYIYARNNPLKYVDPTGEDFELAVTFTGGVSAEEKARILDAIRQYLTNLKIGNVVVRDTAAKDGDKRTWGQWFKDAFVRDYQSITIDFRRSSHKDAPEYIFAGNMAGTGEFSDLRKSDPGQWSNIVAWRALHETVAHELGIGSSTDQARSLSGGVFGPGLRDDQLGTLVGGAYGRGRSGIPGLSPIDTRRIQNLLRPRTRSYGR